MLMKNRSCSHQQPKAKFHHFLSLLPRQFPPGVAAAVRITAADCLDGFTVFSSVSLNKSQAPPVCTLKQVSPAVIAHPRSNVCEEEQNPHSVLILCKNTLRSLSEDDMRPQPSAVEPESR